MADKNARIVTEQALAAALAALPAGGTGAVSSVAGRTGAVTLSSSDVGLGKVSNATPAELAALAAFADRFLPRSEYAAGGATALTVVGTALNRLYAGIARRDTMAAPIVSTGSSTAGGQGATSDPRQLTVRTVIGLQTDYPLASGAAQPVTKELGAVAGTTLPVGVQHIKAAISGSNSGTYLTDTTAAQVGALNPIAVFHMVGSNDYSVNRPPATVKADILSWAAKIDAAVTNGKLPVHIGIHAHRRMNVSNPTYPWSAYGAVHAELAATYPDRFAFINLYAGYTRTGQDTIPGHVFMDSDKIHLSDTGHAFGADMLRAALQETVAVNTAAPSGADPAQVSTTDATAPTISTFAATPGNAQVALSWTGTDNVAITRWLLKRGSTTLYDGTATSYTETALMNGTGYTYTLNAYDAAGNVSNTATVSATPTNAADTTAPTISSFTATSGNAQSSLAWAGSDNVAITRWVAKRGTTTIYDGTATSYVDTGLMNGTQYTYNLNAYDAAGNVSTTSSATSTPAAPASTGTDYTTGMIWNFDADTVTGIADGAVVDNWTSTQGSAGSLTLTKSSNPALMRASALNGHNALGFDSSIPRRLMSPGTTAPVVVGTGATYVYVIKRTGTMARAIGGVNSANYHTLADTGTVNGITFGIEALSGSNTLTYTTSILGRWVLLIAVASGSASKLVVGNEATVTGTLSTSNGIGVSVGGSGSGTGYGNFDLAAYRAYDHAFTDAEISTLRSALNARYGLT